MMLFGGVEQRYRLITEPDCMTPHVWAELLSNWDPELSEDQARTPEGAFAWMALFANHDIVAPVLEILEP